MGRHKKLTKELRDAAVEEYRLNGSIAQTNKKLNISYTAARYAIKKAHPGPLNTRPRSEYTRIQLDAIMEELENSYREMELTFARNRLLFLKLRNRIGLRNYPSRISSPHKVAPVLSKMLATPVKVR